MQQLSSQDIDLWHVDLADADWDGLANVLDPDEAGRANSQQVLFGSQDFGRSRIALRCVLASYGDAAPAQLTFRRNAFGKPALVGQGPFFSLARSRRFALLAVASTPLGLDLEWVNEWVEEVHLMADLLLHTSERVALDMRAPNLRRQVDQAWVGKEAYLKWLGTGSRRPLWSFRITSAASGNLLTIEDSAYTDLPATYVYPVAVPEGFLSFLCSTIAEPRMRAYHALPGSCLAPDGRIAPGSIRPFAVSVSPSERPGIERAAAGPGDPGSSPCRLGCAE